MKFYIIAEIDETETSMSKREIVDYTMDSLAEALKKTGAYFDIGCPVDTITSGPTN